MPEAERNTEVPSQSYGEGTQRAEFEEMTTPQGSTEQPGFFVPQPAEKPTPPPPVQGNPLAPDMFAALARPAVNVESDDEDLARWVPVLNEIASLPGASKNIRALAREVNRRFSAEG